MKAMEGFLFGSAAMVLVGAGVAARASDVVQIGASKDNTLYHDAGALKSNALGQFMFAGRTSGSLGSIKRRALIEFDVAGAIPAGATIESVTLRLEMDQTIAGAVPVSLHRVLAEWGEGTSKAVGSEGTGADPTPGDATWQHTFFDTMFWQTEGGDYAAAPSATVMVAGPGSYTWGSTPEMVADVQAWLDDPNGNHGWIIIGDESTFTTAKRFGTKDHVTPSLRPVLEVEFSAGCYADCDGTGTLDLFDFLCFVNAFNNGDPYADCDGTGTLDLFDFLCFVNEFNAGC